MHQWQIWNDFLVYAKSLAHTDEVGLLIVLSAASWFLQKHRNDICFNNAQIKSARTIILMITSLCLYWTGNMKKKFKDAVGDWLPVIEYAIPLSQYMPLPMVVYQPTGQSQMQSFLSQMMKSNNLFCTIRLSSLSSILSGLVLANLKYFWNLASVMILVMYDLLSFLSFGCGSWSKVLAT